MAENSLQRGHIHPALRIVLVSSLVIWGVVLFACFLWVFHKIHYSHGLELAEVSAAFLSILVLTLIGVGIRAGLRMDRFIRHRKVEVCRIYRSSSHVRHLVSLLGYEEIQLEGGLRIRTQNQDAEEILALIEKPRRRGRSPTHPLDKWTKVVLAWENRDPVRNPMTLTEFLCEQFGEYADGSPRMSENSFYENRKKVIAELRKGVSREKFSES